MSNSKVSTSITTSNGLLVVNQFPQDPSDKTTLPAQHLSSNIPDCSTVFPIAKVSRMTVMFLRGEPQTLGTVQIFIGLLWMLFGASAFLSINLAATNAPYFIGVIFVVSGSLAVAARNGTRRGLIKGVLAVHVVSVLFAVWFSIGLAHHIYIMFAHHGPPRPDPCDLGKNNESMYSPTYSLRSERCAMARELVLVVRGVLLLLCVLEVCVSITVCVFSGRALRVKQDSPHVVVMESCNTSFELQTHSQSPTVI